MGDDQEIPCTSYSNSVDDTNNSNTPAANADDTKESTPASSSIDNASGADQIRSANWSGSIPIRLTLAPTSLSSTIAPSPIHVLVPRHTFLHVGLEEAVQKLHNYAPPSFSFGKMMQVKEPDNMPDDDSKKGDSDNEKSSDNAEADTKDDSKNRNAHTTVKPPKPYPVCWFEDERTHQPLKWQYFVGVLFDCIVNLRQQHSTQGSPIPWKIRLHFNNYPTQTLLELDPVSGVLTSVERTFKNSLKQALVLVHGNSKVALNLTKQSHQSIWQAIQRPSSVNYNNLYKPILVQEMQPKDDKDTVMIPIRLSLDSMTTPLLQKRWDNVLYAAKDGKSDDTNNEQKEQSKQTLGDLLCKWAPHLFVRSMLGRFEPKNPSKTMWYVAGISPPLSTPLMELWRTLAQPDNFLYIIVRLDTGDAEMTH